MKLAALLIGSAVLISSAKAENNPALPNSPSTKETTAQKQTRAGQQGNLTGHGGPVKAIAVSPSGNYALTGSFDYSMIYWDISGDIPKSIHRFDEHNGPVNAVAFLPGEKRALAAGDDGTLTLWDLETKKPIHRFNGHKGKIIGLAISTDGKWAATASWDRTAHLWDLQNLEDGPKLEAHKGPVNAVAFANFEGREVLYSASYDSTIRRWNMTTGEMERKVYSHGWGLNMLLPINNGAMLVFGSLNGDTGLVDSDSGELKKRLPAHNGPVLALAKSTDDSLLAFGGGDGAIRIWSLKDGELLEQYDNPYGPIWALSLHPDGTSLYYGGLDDFATFWQINPRMPFEPVASKFPRRFQKNADMPLGERQFARKCSVCHTLLPEGGNRAGPTLYGVFGRKAGTIKGYAYSKALKESDIVWNEQTIAALFEQGPDEFTPGSKMPLQKIADREKREALIDYLKNVAKTKNGPGGEVK